MNIAPVDDPREPTLIHQQMPGIEIPVDQHASARPQTSGVIDDLALADPFALGGHGQRLLQLLAEDDVLDQHALDLHAPAAGHLLDYLADGLGNLLAALDDVLSDEGRLARLAAISQRLQANPGPIKAAHLLERLAIQKKPVAGA